MVDIYDTANRLDKCKLCVHLILISSIYQVDMSYISDYEES